MFQDTTPRFWYRLGIITGIVLSALVVTAIFALRDQLDSQWFSWTYRKLRDWQTMLAALIALYGALLAVWAIERQIRQAADQEEDRRERREYAARIELPSAFVAVLGYLKANLEAWRALVAGGSPAMPAYPFAAIPTIRACVEAAHRDQRENLAYVPRRLQVAHSRLDSEINGSDRTPMIRTDMYVGEVMLEVLELLVRVNRGFQYARGAAVMAGKPSLGEMSTAASFENLDETDFPALFEALRREYGVETGANEDDD